MKDKNAIKRPCGKKKIDDHSANKTVIEVFPTNGLNRHTKVVGYIRRAGNTAVPGKVVICKIY